MTAAPEPRSAPADASLPLGTLRPGQQAVVTWVDPELPLGRRLRDLGFVPGTPVRVLRRAPLGDPVVYEARGTRLCLRRADAAYVWVLPLAEDGA